MAANCSSATVGRRAVVGVLGGGAEPLSEDLAARCHSLGELIASRGWHLLTGGGRGVMTAVARAFVAVDDRAGISLGILPGEAETGAPPPGYPNPFVELAIRTHLPERGERGASSASRNHLNVLSADALVALPGGAGTVNEVRLALRYARPVLLYAWDVDRTPLDLDREAEGALELPDVATWLDRRLGAEVG